MESKMPGQKRRIPTAFIRKQLQLDPNGAPPEWLPPRVKEILGKPTATVNRNP